VTQVNYILCGSVLDGKTKFLHACMQYEMHFIDSAIVL